MDFWNGLQNTLRRALVARGARSSEIEVAGRRVHYYDVVGKGSGPPLILVHGLASSGTSFSRVMFALSKRFRRVLVPDLPGNGFSPLPESGPLPLEEQLDVLRVFTIATTREPAVMVGNSLGGAMALMLAVRWPELLRALVLVSPAGARVAPERIDELVAALSVRDAEGARKVTRRLFHRTPLLPLLFAPRLLSVYGTATVKSILQEVKHLDMFQPEVLAKLKVPTLLLWGASEKLLPYESIDYFVKHLPKAAQIEVVKGFGHIPQLERPRQVVKRLIQFADGLSL